MSTKPEPISGDTAPGEASARLGPLRATRAVIRKNPTANRVYRTSVGVVGTGTVLLGVALIPLPGPGSLIALGGLALLGTEFEGAKKTSRYANAKARAAAKAVAERRARKKAERQAHPAA